MSDLVEHLNAGALTALSTARMTASSIVIGMKVMADPIHLDEIPATMDKMGWEVSARLMRRWFATRPAYAMPAEIRGGKLNRAQIDYEALPKDQVNDDIVKMKWLLNYASVVEVFEDLISNWNNAKAVSFLKRAVLTPAGWVPGKTVQIGLHLKNATSLDRHAAVNSRPFGEYYDVLDDLYGAIFKATLKVAVVGRAVYSWSRKSDIFEVEKLGVYMRDTYDFNADSGADFMGLGIWSRNRVLTKLEMLDYRTSTWAGRAVRYPEFVRVTNADFTRWQKRNNTGGDFFAFSDVMWIAPPVDFILL